MHFGVESESYLRRLEKGCLVLNSDWLAVRAVDETALKKNSSFLDSQAQIGDTHKYGIFY